MQYKIYIFIKKLRHRII